MKTSIQTIIGTIFFVVFLMIVLLSFKKIATDKKEKRQEYLRKSFSPMSEDAEIREAYESIIEIKTK